MNCRAGFYATIINIVAYPSLVGLPRCCGSTGQGRASSHKRVMQISLVFLLAADTSCTSYATRHAQMSHYTFRYRTLHIPPTDFVQLPRLLITTNRGH